MMIAYCGLVCDQCDALQATLADDQNLRRETAEKWSKLFNHKFSPSDIQCRGCKSDAEPLFAHCHTCQIRLCALEHELEHCGQCTDYPCDNLSEFHLIAPEAKIRLDELRGE